MKDLNNHYCLATKSNYDKLVEDGYAYTEFDKNYSHILIEYGEIDFYNPRDNDDDDLIPMHLHNNSWVLGSLEYGIKYTEDGLLDYETYAETRRKPKEAK